MNPDPTGPADPPVICSTGISGLDKILGGGLPRDRLYAIEGPSGVGKTTLGLQFLFEGVRLGEKVLYITLSETKAELAAIAASHGWSLEGIAIVELTSLQQFSASEQSTVFHSSEIELNHATRALAQLIGQADPRRIVFDSLFELRLLAQAAIRYRRHMLALKQLLAPRAVTVLLLEDPGTIPPDMRIDNMVNGVIRLEALKTEYGAERRRLSVVKLRGVGYRSGNHDYVIRKGGLQVFPRLVASADSSDYPKGRVSGGLANLDTLLGGGLDRGTSTLIIGPAGSGKSLLSAQFAFAAAQRGDRVLILSFEESTRNLLARCAALGMPLEEHVAQGRVRVVQIDPAELTPGEVAVIVTDHVHAGFGMVLIDSLNGYLQAMVQEQFLVLHLHELLAQLSRLGAVTLLVLAQHGLVDSIVTPADVTYLADTVIVLRYFEAVGRVRKAISVVKKRNGPHENTIRELSVTDGRLAIGDEIAGFQGIFTGIPALAPPLGALRPGPGDRA
jgi:circadian clock protein KaiC